jgi:formyl-CoA transferase
MDRAEFYREARTGTPGPLAGLRVLDVTTVWSGPMTTCLLGDLGADVIRVEMPGNRAGRIPPKIPGTNESWFHQTVNRNKRGIGVDLRVPAGQALFLRLAATADLVVENFRPGTLDEWGVGYQRLRSVREDVVLVSISGFGQFGPASGRRGYDPIIQAEAGWMALNGPPDGEPTKAPTFLADDIVALHATVAALAALRHRDATGEGQHVDVAMLDALLYQSDGFPTLAATGVPLTRWGNEAEFVVPSNCYACTDGHVYLVVALDKHWRRLVEVIDRPDLAALATNHDRRARREEVNKAVGRWCQDRPVAEVVATFERAGLAVGRVRTPTEAATDPHVRARDMLQPTEMPDGSTAPLVGPAAKFSRTPTSVRTAAPQAGVHTDEVLDELGVGAEERASLRAAGAI